MMNKKKKKKKIITANQLTRSTEKIKWETCDVNNQIKKPLEKDHRSIFTRRKCE